MFIFIDKLKNRVELYGCAKIMFDTEKELIKISVGHYYNLGTSDYETDVCKICKRDVKRSKQDKLPLPEPIKKELPLPVKQTNIKYNVPLNTFVIKTFGTLINIDGEVMEMDTQKPYFEHKGKKYNLPTKTFGDIETLLC